MGFRKSFLAWTWDILSIFWEEVPLLIGLIIGVVILVIMLFIESAIAVLLIIPLIIIGLITDKWYGWILWWVSRRLYLGPSSKKAGDIVELLRFIL